MYEDMNEKTGATTLNLERIFEFITTSVEVGGKMKLIVEAIDFIQGYAWGSCEVSVSMLLFHLLV